MKAIINLRYLTLMLMIGVLTACGGGGSSGTGGGTQAPNPPTIMIASATSLPANPLGFLPTLDQPTTIQVNVTVRSDTLTPVPDGTTVNMTTSNAAVGTLSIGDDPGTTGVNEFTGQFASIGTTTAGGIANFFLTSGPSTGTTVLTASATDPVTGTGLSASITITTTPSTGPDNRITLTPTDTTLPLNTFGVMPFIGSPFLAEIGIEYIGADGDPVNPAGDIFSVTIAPATVATYSTPDDPDTDDVNEFVLFTVTGPVDANAGQNSVFVNASTTPGTAVLTVSASDAITGENFSNSVTFTIADGAANGIPASVGVPVPMTPVFVQGLGGNTVATIESLLLDGGGLPADDPVNGEFNNIMVELSPPNANGSFISGTSAAGTPVSGNSINITSVNGIASFALTSGSTAGPHVLTVTGDRADNNVDNGIQDAVSNIGTVIVGDGELANIELVSDLFAGPSEVSDAVLDGTTPGTLMLPVGVIATDRFGAPVLPGTPIIFGKVDAPVDNVIPTSFIFSGFNGNPSEGGTFFSVPVNPADGFLDDPVTVDESVELGDTLVTFGKEVPDNDELESSRVVGDVLTNQSLSVTVPFNNNDPTGAVENDGAVIPYVIGRSELGNIGNTAVTDASGGAVVMLTYPNNVLGQPLVLWAQGTRPDGSETQTVGDAASIVFPGQGPALLAISPSSVQGNSSRLIELCLTDANGAAISNAGISFVVNGSFNFSVTGAPLITGLDGCVTTNVTSSGIMNFDLNTTVTFTAAGASADLLLTDPMLASLTVAPTALALPMAGDSGMVTVLAEGADGDPAAGAVITSNCTADISIDFGMAITAANGTADFVITADIDDVVGSCSFTSTIDSQFVGDNVGINAPGGGGVGVSP